MIKQIDLSNLHNESAQVREALAFYVMFTLYPTNCTSIQRACHYDVLERAGYIEKVGADNGTSEGILPLSHVSAQA